MKKRFFSFLCAAILLCSVLPMSRAEEGEEGPFGLDIEATQSAQPQDTIAQIGLYYGSSAMDGINLENNIGVGERLG